MGEAAPRDLSAALSTELARLVAETASGLRVELRGPPHAAGDDYLQARIRFEGPIGAGTVKVEASHENPVGPWRSRILPPSAYGYPRGVKVRVYTLENMMTEKLRAMAERRRVRDYYDVWKLARTRRVDWRAVRRLWPEKARFKGVRVRSLDDLFPEDLEATLAPFLRAGLTRLTREPLPPLSDWVREARAAVAKGLGAAVRTEGG